MKTPMQDVDYLRDGRERVEYCLRNRQPCPFCGQLLGHTEDCAYPGICEALDEEQVPTAGSPTLTVTHTNGATYGVPVAVAKGIGRLRTDRDKTLGTVEMLRDRIMRMGEIGEGYRVELHECQAEVSRLSSELAAAWKVADGLSVKLEKALDFVADVGEGNVPDGGIEWLLGERERAMRRGNELRGKLHDCQAALARLRGDSQYPAPTSTAAELPPEGEDILWWYPHRYGSAWVAGRYEASEDFPPGYLTGGGTWCLCDGPQCDGPTWWMYPPPDPTGGNNV